MRKVIFCFNLSKKISHHLFGKNHTPLHRRIVGGFIMVFGVSLVKLSYMSTIFVFHFFGDMVGFAFHGIGLIPYINYLETIQKISTENERESVSE